MNDVRPVPLSEGLACRASLACFAALALCVLCLGILGVPRASAQPAAPADPATIDLADAREPLTVVSTRWRFHPGDDLSWADPALNDTSWPVINPAESWSGQTPGAAGEFAWFRFRVRRSPGIAQLVLEMPPVAKNYQLFVDGREIASIGDFKPGGAVSTPAPRVFTLPASPPGSAVTVLALRLQTPRQYAWNSPDLLRGPVRVGAPAAMLAAFDRGKAWRLLQRDGMNYTTALIQVPIFAAAVLLLLLTRERFYLWFALEMLIGVCQFATHLAAAHFGWSFGNMLAANILWDFATGAVLALFLAGYLRLTSLRLVYLAILTQALAEIGPALVPFHLPALWANILYFVFITVSDLLLLWLIYRVWRSGEREVGLFLIPYLLSTGLVEIGNFGYILIELNVSAAQRWIPAEFVLLSRPFAVTLLDVANIIALFGYLAVLVFRFARNSQERQRLAAALAAAHEIQSRLLPAGTSSHAGLHTEVVYLAAEEVGGDFCQVLPRADGSVLAVIGDVSGKGLQAAMVGALAVGVLRSLVEENVGPSVILERMNDVILRSAQHGFVTCLCLEIEPGGLMRVANAGHLAPYVNGREVETEAGLPLGLVAGLHYNHTELTLPRKARLTLLSDGVIEARARNGELFGFDRTTSISSRPAGEIAAAAQEFGQQDDITVVTLNWSAVPAAA